MSRNLCKTNCGWCGCDEVELTGHEHPITPDEAGRYFSEFAGLIVADAECMACGAKYLAWVDERGRKPWRHPLTRLSPGGEPYIPDHVFDRYSTHGCFFDLSYRSSFNDEPGDADVGFASREEIRGYLRQLRELLDKERVAP